MGPFSGDYGIIYLFFFTLKVSHSLSLSFFISRESSLHVDFNHFSLNNPPGPPTLPLVINSLVPLLLQQLPASVLLLPVSKALPQQPLLPQWLVDRIYQYLFSLNNNSINTKLRLSKDRDRCLVANSSSNR